MVTRLIGLGVVYAIRPINARVARRLGALVSGSVRSLSLALPSILLEMEDSGDNVVWDPRAQVLTEQTPITGVCRLQSL